MAGLTPPAPLTAEYDLEGFASGAPALDAWLRRHGRSAQGLTARTYVVCEDLRVVAFYCLSAGAVARADWSRKLQRNAPRDVPVFVLGRLAVDQRWQGQGLGRDLLRHAMRQCMAAHEHVGARALIVHPLNGAATGFYRTFGFQELSGRGSALFMPLATIVDALP